MQIVLPGALPDAREAPELADHLADAAPTLLSWLQGGKARIIDANPSASRCIPFEQWQLAERRFVPDKGQDVSAGLGPLLWPGRDQEPVWLAELVHVSPSRDGAALLPAADIAIGESDSQALYDSATALFEGTGFELMAHGTQRWRVRPPEGFAPSCASPSLVAITSVNDWWEQDPAGRPWRRLVNELQMAWFDHPVNVARGERGLPPLNSLWLFGGARPAQLTAAAPPDARIHMDLLAASTRHDWHAWLEAWRSLESRVFRSMKAAPRLVLMGRQRIVEVEPAVWRPWANWTRGGKEKWRTWWSHQN